MFWLDGLLFILISMRLRCMHFGHCELSYLDIKSVLLQWKGSIQTLSLLTSNRNYVVMRITTKLNL